MNTNWKTFCVATAVAGMMGGTAIPAKAEIKVTGGTTTCNGSFFYRADHDETHMGAWNFSNPNDDVTIKVDRVRVFTADGNQVLEYPSEQFPLPPPDTKVELKPFQSTQVRMHDVFGGPDGYLPKKLRPVQLIVDWSMVEGRGYAPDAETITEIRVGGQGYLGGAVIARNSHKCRLLRSAWR